MIARPRISVLLPVFNSERTLDSCLRSVERQTETDWECVIVDDGSTDGSSGIARRFGARDPRFRIVAREHRGLIDALNIGIEHCRGQLVARMDADDLMRRDRLERQRAALDGGRELAAVGCHVRLFPRGLLRDGARAYERWINGLSGPRSVRTNAFVECPVVHPTLMLRRDRLSALGYRHQGWPEDYDLILRMLAAGDEIGVVPRRLLAWRDGPDRLWRTAPDYRLERFVACKAAFLSSGLLARSERYVLWGFGPTGKALRQALAAHGHRPSHIVELHPGRLGNRIDDAPLISPDELRDLPRQPLISAVAGPIPRQQIRDKLIELGYRELLDFVCAA